MVVKVRRVNQARDRDLEINSIQVLLETMGVDEMVPLNSVQREKKEG